jgi:hypothetical protein
MIILIGSRTMNTKKIKEDFIKILQEWQHFESVYDNDMATAGIEPPIDPVDYFTSHLTQVRKETLEEVEKIIPKGKGNDYENLGMGSLDYHEKNAVDGYIEWLKAHISKLKK